MLKKIIAWTDFDEHERKEEFFFNLSKSELMEMELVQDGGMENMLQKIIDAQDRKKMVEIFKDLIMRSYGEKTPDGKRFVKSKELSEAFSQTGAYDVLFMELTTDAGAAAAFINGAMPQSMAAEVTELSRKQGVAAVT